MSYTIDYKNKLNEEQLKAVMHHEGPCLVIAGAGTGKTTTLVYRVARLIEDGVKPSSILFLTFTRKAAENMHLRCSTMLDERCTMVNASTFHGFALSELRHYAIYTGFRNDFKVIDQNDAGDMIGLVKEELQTASFPYKIPSKGIILSILSKSITRMLTISETISQYYQSYKRYTELIELIEQKYTALKKENNVMFYDDLLWNFSKLLMKYDSVRKTLSEKYKFIMIDEYQDTDKIQARIATQIAGDSQNIMAVGDDAQSIYAFRGADFRNIMSFPELFKKTRTITIEHNYRSTKEILTFSNAIMTNASERFDKNLKTNKSNGEKPALIFVKNNHHQSLYIADAIGRLIQEGYALKDIAVLFRNSHYSHDLETVLNKRGYPFKKFGGLEFGSRGHIRDMMAFIKVGINLEDRLSWIRILTMFPKIGVKTATRIIDKMLIDKKGIEHLRDTDLDHLYNLIISLHLDHGNPYKKVKLIADFYRPIFQVMRKYSKNKWKDIEALETVASDSFSLEELINSISTNGLNEESSDSKSNQEYLTLSTIHSAKGLEWGAVFIICVNDGCMPCLQRKGSKEDIDEEVRVFHVAATRAKDHLYLIAPQVQAFQGSSGNVSPFLTDKIIADCLSIEDDTFQSAIKTIIGKW